ncbi:ATP-binding protein [Micromonospora sp. NPDC049559]|uniref:sensor histidine kinase n=1 Tax=Micromonospora sp. NPDC049559 TaxID=3155923 RepID=UPI00342E02E1
MSAAPAPVSAAPATVSAARATGSAAPVTGSAAAAGTGAQRAELVLLRAYVLFRLAGLLQVLVALSATYPHYHPLAGGVALVGALVVESLLLVAVAVRRRGVPGLAPTVLDSVLLAAGMFGSAVLASRTVQGHTWVFFMYPFALLAVLGIALAARTLPVVAALVGLIAVAYAVAAVTIVGDPTWNVVPNAVPYLANAGVAWAVAGTLRRSGADLDRATAATARREAELASERERSRHARLLHDRVLQTMETLARDRWVADDGMRALVAADAGWLRSLVTAGRPPGGDGDLAGGLEQLAARQALAGLRVRVHAAQLRSASRGAPPLAAELVDTVVGAVGEALTNVAKHAGVPEVVVRAELAEGELLISVLDRGRGFDPALPRPGVGLARSVREPIEALGGRVAVDSAPGAGTYVELTIPVRGPGGRVDGEHPAGEPPRTSGAGRSR